MQFQVPQFIEVEDKIVGPLTFKQFIYLAGGGGVIAILYAFLPLFFVILLGIPVAAFALAVGEISPPVHSDYGWHVIKAITPVKSTPAHTTPFKEAKASIKQQLLTAQQDELWAKWTDDLKKQYEGKVSYQAGYAPPATTALTDTNLTTPG